VRIAVIGHLEWVEFLRLSHVPAPGAIVHTRSLLHVPAGGGGVAAVQLARWLGSCRFYTALGDDELGRRAEADLTARGVEVCCVFRGTQRRAITLVDDQRERTILVIGERHVPHATDPLPWDELAKFDAVYITGGDAGAVRAARAAPIVVATSRIVPLLREAAIPLDAIIGSAADPGERYDGEIVPPPRMIVRTEGARGGSYEIAGTRHRYDSPPTEVTGDTYGAGDTFAAALTLALAQRTAPAEAMREAAARAIEVLRVTGPYQV
jgi:ribokinase